MQRLRDKFSVFQGFVISSDRLATYTYTTHHQMHNDTRLHKLHSRKMRQISSESRGGRDYWELSGQRQDQGVGGTAIVH